MGRHFKNNATGGGCSERVNTKRLKKPVAALVALVATCVVAVSAYATVPAVRNAVDTVRDNLVAAVTGSNAAQTRAVSGAKKTVDPDTTNAWSNIAASSNSTENIGRIWTDKSVFSSNYDFEGALEDTSVVKGSDSDFLVGLSAISSTSNLKSVVTNTTPLDIVLVLDVSGSMDESIGETETTTYQEVYDGRNWGLNTRSTYYVRSGNDYIAVTWEGGYNGSWQDREGNEYEPRTSRNDNNRNHVQFYQQITASESAGSKIDALKEAANGFAETFATMNDGITDTSKQHRISVVKFSGNESNQVGNDTYREDGNTYNYSQVVSDLSSYTTQTVSALERTINSLDPAGSTRADYGLSQAERVLNGDGSLTGAREGAQKVVIFFTDGQPSTFSNWSGTVAANAINTAHDMKQSGTLVYTIGVFEDANPSDTNTNFNRYMNAVSSNYPNAECAANVNVGSYWNPQYEWQQTSDFDDLGLGSKVEGEEGEEAPQYYYSATNAVGLEQVFKDITESLPINQGSGSPIEEQEGAAGTPGFLTFTDTLGSFMEVTGVGADNDKMYLAFADGLHEGTPNADGTEWTFSGVVNEGNGVNTAYPEGADLSEIKVTVTKSGNLATGDTITVQIPASLIPMRNYDVDTDNGTMTVSDTYPVRLFYGVSVKDAAIDALNDPQNANHDAVLARTSADGKTIDFYSNSFVQGAAQGTTEASFTPSDGNKFYYYPVNTQLFIDKGCTQPATRYNIGNYSTLYYQDSHWELTGTGDEAVEVPTTGSITRSGNDWNVTYQDNNAYIAADTPRADRPATLVSNKGENLTGTASTVLTPTWNGASVSQKLGNNGKLSIDAPGDLRIDKTVNWGNASSETQADKNSFKFTVHLYTVGEDGAEANLTNKYNYAVYATSETPVSTGTISDNGEITLAAGQYVVISDLPNGAQYTVTEQAANQNGFATTDNSTGENANTDDGIVEGTIVGGSQQTASFTNTYHATEVTLEGANQLVKVKKNLTGREWQDTDEFRFTMLSEGNAPAPESIEAVVVDDEDADTDYTVNLSNITFENPGTFTYVIEEDNDTNPIAGIDYSNETYAVTITVVDNGTGALEIQSVQFEQRADVDGNKPAEQPQITDNTVVFTNNYDATEATTNLNGRKYYTDKSGANPNAANKFTFELKAIGGYATEGGSAESPTIGAADVPMPAGTDADTYTITTGNNGTNPDGFAFQTIKYNGTHLNNAYIYEIREVIPEGATDNGDGTWSLHGMTYDGTVHTVTVAITDEPNDQGEGMHIVATPSMQPADVEFTNVYDPEDYTLEGDEAIHGTKVLQGREIGDGETFYFELKQTSGPETVLTDSEVKTVTKDSSMDFAFSELTFSKAGTYTFTVNEVADDQGTETADGSGMTYSQNVAKVTIKVKDGGNGALVLDGPIVYENQGSDETGKAVFTNVYEASMNYGAQGEGGINVTKQLLDRPMTAGEFDFTITGEGDAAGLTAEDDKNFQNTGAAADQTITMAKLQSLTFDETDAGKTYTFIVDENEPAEGDGLAGVTYDKSQYKVEIEVVDNGNGTMHAVTTVTQTMDEDGNEIADGGTVVVDHANSDAVDYAVPTFGFVNDYNPNSVDMGEDTDNALQVTKKVTGAPSAANYTFTLTAQNTAEGSVANIEGLDENHQATVTTNGTIEAGSTQTLSFDTLTFTEPGTYTFTVQENQPAADDGWTFDTDARTITVEVTDVNPDYEPGGDAPQYDGNLYIGKVTGNNPTIENKYDHGSVTIGGDAAEALTVEKTVKGWSTESDFHFTFAPVEEEGVDWSTVEYDEGTADKTAVTENFADGDTHSAQFGEITFTEPGTYTFNVTEDEAHDETADPAGWTYDTDTETITVTVSEIDADGNYDGSLHATVSGSAKFENTYHANPGTVSEGTESAFNLTKQLTGRDEKNSWVADDEFTFTLTPGTATDLEGNPVEDLTVPMPADSADGIKKVTVGADKAGENGIASIDFGAISYERTGIYTYKVTEENAGKTIDGITYDGRTVTITVNVTDNGNGGLVAAVAKTGEAETASFVNTYNSTFDYGANGKGGIDITKMLENRDMTEGQFTFTVTSTGDAAEKIGGEKLQMTSAASTAGEAASVANNPFDGIAFDRNDSGVDFVYTIVEDQTDGDGYICDTSTYKVTITPSDNGDGTMSVTTVVADSDGDHSMTVEDATADDPQVATVPFENTYDAGDVTVGAKGDATIVAKKVLENDDIANYAGAFTFKVTSGDTVVATGENNADGSITFDKITYTSENLYDAAHGGSAEVGTASLDDTGDVDVYTFNYTVSEDKVTVDGVTYKSGNDSSVTVTVTDDRAGNLDIEVVHKPSADGLVFTNTYGAGETAEVTIDGNKNLTGINGAQAPDLTDGMFEFTITGVDENGNAAPLPDEVTVGNMGPGISFGPITYEMEEVFGNQAAQTDIAETDAAEQTDEAVETEGAEVEGEATEVETTDEAAAESETTDEIVAGESAPAEDEDIELYTVGRTKTYTYTISETNAGKTIDGIAYDSDPKTVKVTVKDNGDGTISAAVTKVADGADANMDFTFNNTYSVTPEESTPTGEGALTFTKVWDRQGGTRELAAGDFTFQLKAGDEVVSTGTNDADGNVEMSTIKFTQAGEYSYELREVVPEGATPVDGGYEKDGVLYLNTSYTVTANVTDNHNGTLSVAWSMTDANGDDVTTATFVNTYFVSDTSVTFGAAKALEGRAVKDGEFTFELRDAKGNVLGTATNDETGQIVFADAVQSFGSAGEYDFVIAEVLPEDDDAATEGIQKDGVTYDETTYTAHVVVSDDNKGNLVVTELTYNGEAALPTFKNSYEEPKEPVTPEKPAKPEENIPQTGDNTIAMVGGCALAAVALIGGGIFLRRRNSDQQ